MVNLIPVTLTRQAHRFRHVVNWAESRLFPPTCVLCADSGQAPRLDLCAGCMGDLLLNDSACPRCAEPLPVSAANNLCGECLRRAPRVHAAHCAYRYEFPVDHLVRGLKYHGRLAYARIMGELLAQRLQATRVEPWPECIVPVPLADARFRERGFNQAIEIGRELQTKLDIPLRSDAVVRTRDTREQAGLDRAERRKNVRNAFKVIQPLHGQRIAILDDVVTTGSTANELARVLRKAGAEHIEVWSVARAGSKSLWFEYVIERNA
jgi:ComF family protein